MTTAIFTVPTLHLTTLRHALWIVAFMLMVMGVNSLFFLFQRQGHLEKSDTLLKKSRGEK